MIHDTRTGNSKRLLENQHSVTVQDYIIQANINEMVFFGLVALRPGIDGITLDAKGEYLYYGTMPHDKLYRVKTSLINSADQLTDKDVEIVGIRPLSDGLSTQ